MNGYHNYTIKTKLRLGNSDDKDTFDTNHRYSSFEKLRNFLCLQNPLIFVPAIPPKSALIKTKKAEHESVQQRKIDLENFLKELTANQDLFSSEILKSFLTNTNEFNSEEFSKKYQQEFDMTFLIENENMGSDTT